MKKRNLLRLIKKLKDKNWISKPKLKKVRMKNSTIQKW